MSASETLRKTSNKTAKKGSPLRSEMPCSSRSDKRESPHRKGSQSPSVSRQEKSSSPAPMTDKQHSPALRKSARGRDSPLRTDSSDSDHSNLTPKKVCSPKRTSSPLTKSSPFKSSSANVKNSPLKNSPQRKPQKSESIHNDVHPAVIDNIRRSLDNEDQGTSEVTSEVNASVSSASEVSDVSKHDDSMDIAADSRDYTKYLGKESGKMEKLCESMPNSNDFSLYCVEIVK